MYYSWFFFSFNPLIKYANLHKDGAVYAVLTDSIFQNAFFHFVLKVDVTPFAPWAMRPHPRARQDFSWDIIGQLEFNLSHCQWPLTVLVKGSHHPELKFLRNKPEK